MCKQSTAPSPSRQSCCHPGEIGDTHATCPQTHTGRRPYKSKDPENSKEPGPSTTTLMLNEVDGRGNRYFFMNTTPGSHPKQLAVLCASRRCQLQSASCP